MISYLEAEENIEKDIKDKLFDAFKNSRPFEQKIIYKYL